MERLTFDGNFCDISQCRELPCQYNTACMQRQVLEKFKAYEDTGRGRRLNKYGKDNRQEGHGVRENAG